MKKKKKKNSNSVDAGAIEPIIKWESSREEKIDAHMKRVFSDRDHLKKIYGITLNGAADSCHNNGKSSIFHENPINLDRFKTEYIRVVRSLSKEYENWEEDFVSTTDSPSAESNSGRSRSNLSCNQRSSMNKLNNYKEFLNRTENR